MKLGCRGVEILGIPPKNSPEMMSTVNENQVLKLSQMACEKEAQDDPAYVNWKSSLHLCTCAKVSKSLKSGIKSAADAVT